MNRTHVVDKIMKVVFLVAAFVSVASVVIICLFLIINAVPAFKEIGPIKFLFGTVWKPSNDIYGILPMVLGSIYATAGSLVIGVPIGILTATFMAKFCPKPIYKILKPATELLSGIPSVVYGLFGLTVIVPAVRNIFGISDGLTLLTTSILLGIMILPTIITVSETSIRAVPESYYEGALALGATKERSIFFVVLPAAKSGILAGVILGVGRALGETMAVVMVCGGQARMPKGLLEGCRTLTANIVLEMGYSQGLHRQALIATAVVLFVFILLINLCFSALSKKKKS